MGEYREGAHGKGPYGERQQRDLLGGVNIPTHKSRRPLMTGTGMFDSLSTPDANTKGEQQIGQKPHRALWFKRNARYYSVDFPVPHSGLEEQNRRVGSLDEAREIEIDPESLTYSDRLKKWVPKPKKEHKTRLYGAFVVVRIGTMNRKGEEVVERRFMSLRDLQKTEDNPFARFKASTK
ncbi:MAG TPA: hypothetical protein VES68_01515 [Candidatus Sulfotelmatobacter sp.]|nr:hypothetical protein [Candidatus Sulfotelmatobacter sp.]